LRIPPIFALRQKRSAGATLAGAILVGAIVGAGATLAGTSLVDSDSGSGHKGGQAPSTRWLPLHRTSVSRYEIAAAEIGHFAYVVGGIPRGAAQPVGTLERYDLTTGRSTHLQSMPVGLDHVGVVAYRGDLIAVGGNPTEGTVSGPTSSTAAVYRYDTKQDRWSKLTSLPDGPRGGAGVAVIGDKLYVAGGAQTKPGAKTSTTIPSLEIFDLKSGGWSRGPDLPTPRTHVSGLAVGGYFYVLGGSNVVGFKGQTLPTVERYNPRSGTWERLPDMPRVHWAFGVADVDGKIVIIGGVAKGGLIPGVGGLAPEVDSFDPVRRHWSTLPGMRTPRQHLAAVSWRNRIYALDGSTTLTPATPTNDVEALDLPHPTSAYPQLEFVGKIHGSQVKKSGDQTTTAGQLNSSVLGSGAVVNAATVTKTTTDGRWTIFTAHGALFAHVLETEHGIPSGGIPKGLKLGAGKIPAGAAKTGHGATSVTLDGTGAITGGTERYAGASGWLDVNEVLSKDFRSAEITLSGTIVYRH
jgi:N-acetylneuraminic acid mutarotase